MGHRRDGANRPPRIRALRSMDNLCRIFRGWLHLFQELHRFGDAVEWSIGPMRETLFFHPDDVGEVLAAAGANGPLGRTFLGKFQEYASVVGNNGLVMSEGHVWRRQRRILQPGMHKQKIAEYANTMVDFAEQMCDRWDDGAALRMQGEMERLTRRIMTRTLFGADLTQAESDEIKRVMDRQLLLNNIEFILGNWLHPRIPTPLRAALRSASDHLRMLLQNVVERRLKEADEAKLKRDTDLLDMLLEARDEKDRSLPDFQVHDELHNLFLGGYETSSNALAFTGVLLARNPDLQNRMRAEIEQAAGAGKLAFEHVRSLPLVEAVVKETLRLYPPIFALPGHLVKTRITMCGYDFQPGERIVVCPYVTQRDPRWFADPDEFRPDRWLDGSTNDLHRYAWFPFGGGPRLCYGHQFAMVEMILTLAVVVRRFSLALPAGASNEIKTKLSGTFMLRAKNDTVTVTARATAEPEANE